MKVETMLFLYDSLCFETDANILFSSEIVCKLCMCLHGKRFRSDKLSTSTNEYTVF